MQPHSPLVLSQEHLGAKDSELAKATLRPIKTNTMAKRPFKNQKLLSIMSKQKRTDTEKEGLLPEEIAFQQMAIDRLKMNIQNQEKV